MVRRIGTPILVSRRLSRTERKIAQKERAIEIEKQKQISEERQQEFEEARAKAQGMTLTQYKQYYPTLPSWLQSSFVPPSQIESERQAKIQENISQLDTQISSAEQNLRALNEQLSRTPEPEARRNIIISIRGQETYISRLKEGRGKLQGGTYLEVRDIESYASASQRGREAYLKEPPVSITVQTLPPTVYVPSPQASEPIQVAYKNIFTGELISAREPPSPEYTRVFISTRGEVLPKDTQTTLSIRYPEYRLPTVEEVERLYPKVVTEFKPPRWIPEKYGEPIPITEPLSRYFYEKGRLIEKIPRGTPLGSVLSTGAGFISGAFLIKAEFGAQLLAEPIKTTESMIKMPYDFYTGELGERIGKRVQANPDYALGYVLGLAFTPFIKTYGKVPATKYTPAGYDILPDLNLWKKVVERSPFVKKAKTEVPTKAMQKAVEPFTRKRATLILKTDKGRYVFGKTKRGEVISIGGGIGKKKPLSAVLKELKEETGLTAKDISGLTFKKKIVFPEETHYVYQAKILESALKRIKPMSDIKEIVVYSPKDIPKVTGQTTYHPFRIQGLRSYEAGIIRFLETGKQPTWLYIETKLGKYYLGTQSRYNVSVSEFKKYLEKTEELSLAHGTPTRDLARRYALWEKKMIIEASKSKRGGVQGLYLQPPVSVKKVFAKFEESFTRRGTPVYLKKRVPKFDIKKISTWQWKLRGRKAGTFYKWTQQEQAGYVGLSYLGIDDLVSLETPAKIGFKPKPSIYILKEKVGKRIIPTQKALKGVESELILQTGEVLRTTGRGKVVWIGGKRTIVQPTEVVKDVSTAKLLEQLKNIQSKAESQSILRKIREKTGVSYEPPETYVSPFSLIPSFKAEEGTRKIVEVKEKITSVREKEVLRVAYKEPSVIPAKERYKSVPYKETEVLKEAYREIRVPKEYIFPREYPPLTPPIIPTTIKPLPPITKKIRRKKKLKLKTFPEEFAYTPAFTERLIGFTPREVSLKEALALTRKVHTGFELRLPVKLRRMMK